MFLESKALKLFYLAPPIHLSQNLVQSRQKQKLSFPRKAFLFISTLLLYLWEPSWWRLRHQARNWGIVSFGSTLDKELSGWPWASHFLSALRRRLRQNTFENPCQGFVQAISDNQIQLNRKIRACMYAHSAQSVKTVYLTCIPVSSVVNYGIKSRGWGKRREQLFTYSKLNVYRLKPDAKWLNRSSAWKVAFRIKCEVPVISLHKVKPFFFPRYSTGTPHLTTASFSNSSQLQ